MLKIQKSILKNQKNLRKEKINQKDKKNGHYCFAKIWKTN